jgi:spore germination protein KC
VSIEALARVKMIDRGVSNKKPGQAGAYEQIELAGAGVFKKDKLIGTLMPSEVSGLLPFIEPLNTRVLILKCPQDKTKKMTVEVKNQKFFVTPSIKNHKPFFTISYSTSGSVVESACPYSLFNPKIEKALKREMENVQKKEIEIVLNKSIKEYQSDFLELGKVYMNKFPSEWNEMKGKWELVYPTSDFTIKSKAEIRDAVLLMRPTKQGGGVGK